VFGVDNFVIVSSTSRKIRFSMRFRARSSRGIAVALDVTHMIPVSLWTISDGDAAVVCREMLTSDRVTVEVLYNGVRFLSGSFVDADAAFAFADHVEQHWQRRCRVNGDDSESRSAPAWIH
jgi:hypothetical protein